MFVLELGNTFLFYPLYRFRGFKHMINIKHVNILPGLIFWIKGRVLSMLRGWSPQTTKCRELICCCACLKRVYDTSTLDLCLSVSPIPQLTAALMFLIYKVLTSINKPLWCCWDMSLSHFPEGDVEGVWWSAETTVGCGQSWAFNLQLLIPSPIRQGQQHSSLAALS